MTREEAFRDINETQEFYVDELISALYDKSRDCMKEQNFTSDTGTGKTRMMAMLCNKMKDVFFVITTLSKGHLQEQIRKNLRKDAVYGNFVVYGLCDFTANTKLQADDILERLPKEKKIVWLRDEGHIKTNKWQELINERCWKIVNISATNSESGISCNFSHTMMLRSVVQQEGTPEDALDKLLVVKKQHKNVPNYNPCAIMRCLDEATTERVISGCIERNLKYINITTDSFDMSRLCEDDCPYDVIINKFKIVEGIDLRRAHVVYMTNEPNNVATTIQIIGRCRRNALLYRNDIDIFSDSKLLHDTMRCYAFFNVVGMKVDTDIEGNLCMHFCDKISCERLKVGTTIHVENGVMDNGLTVIELEGRSGEYRIEKDEETGFNVVNPTGHFYDTQTKLVEPTFNGMSKDEILSTAEIETVFNYGTGLPEERKVCKLSGTRVLNKYDVSLTDKFFSPVKIHNFEYEIYETKKGFALKISVFKRSPVQLDSIKLTSRGNISLPIDIRGFIKSSYTIRYFKTEHELDAFLGKYLSKNRQKELPVHIYMHKEYEYSEIPTLQNRRFLIRGFGSGEKVKVQKDAPLNVTVFKNLQTKEIPIEDIEQFFDKYLYLPYRKTVNDRTTSIIGVDTMRLAKNNGNLTWAEQKPVTTKVGTYCKLNSFITNRYADELEEVKEQLYTGKNKFDFDKKCNSCLGYCVEYYGKYLVYGERYLGKYIAKAQKESGVNQINDNIVVRACMLMYRDRMCEVFGSGIQRLIKTIKIEDLIQSKYRDFVKTVVELGTNVANFVKKEFGICEQLHEGDKLHDPNLSVNHITALADFISYDKIIDIKCTSSITIQHIKQVLAYHYLSTKRDDLAISEVIVFDAVKNKCVRVKLRKVDS